MCIYIYILIMCVCYDGWPLDTNKHHHQILFPVDCGPCLKKKLRTFWPRWSQTLMTQSKSLKSSWARHGSQGLVEIQRSAPLVHHDVPENVLSNGRKLAWKLSYVFFLLGTPKMSWLIMFFLRMALKGAFDPLKKAQPFLTNPTSAVTKGDQGGSRGLDKKTWFFL